MNKTQELILKILGSSEYDLTIQEISEKANLERHTIAKHLETLEAIGLVTKRNVGKSKLHKLTQSPLLALLKSNNIISEELRSILNSIKSHISIQDENFEIIWNNIYAKRKGKKLKCYEEYHGKTEKCEGCPVEMSFKTGKITSKILEDKTEIISQPIKNQDKKTIAVVEIVKRYEY